MRALLWMLPLLLQASPEAEALWERGERAAALERMGAELAAAPGDAELRARLVSAELDVGRFRAALGHCAGLPEARRGLRGRALYFLTDYEACLEHLRFDDRQELLMRAEALRALGRFDELDALQPRLREVLGADDPAVRLIEAQAALRRGEDEVALPILREVLAREPLEPAALFGLGRALVRLGQREEGLEVLERHRRILPLLDALDFARRGVALAPRSASNQVALGEALVALVPEDHRLLAEARAAHERAWRDATRPEVVPVALRCARFRWETTGEREPALALLAEAIERQDDPRLRVRRADYLTALGRAAEALVELEAAARARPTDAAIQRRIDALRDEAARGEQDAGGR